MCWWEAWGPGWPLGGTVGGQWEPQISKHKYAHDQPSDHWTVDCIVNVSCPFIHALSSSKIAFSSTMKPLVCLSDADFVAVGHRRWQFLETVVHDGHFVYVVIARCYLHETRTKYLWHKIPGPNNHVTKYPFSWDNMLPCFKYSSIAK